MPPIKIQHRSVLGWRNCKLWPLIHVRSKSGCLQSVFLHGFRLCLWWWMGSKKNNLPSSPFLSSWQTRWCKFWVHTLLHLWVTSILVSACNLFCLLYKLIFLLLLFCRSVTSKAFRIGSWNFASTHIWVCRLLKM